MLETVSKRTSLIKLISTESDTIVCHNRGILWCKYTNLGDSLSVFACFFLKKICLYRYATMKEKKNYSNLREIATDK